MNVRRFLAALAAVLIVTPALTFPAAAAGPADPPYARYVALGDSYTSAPLVPIVDLLSLGCVRSTSSYPKLLAEMLDVDSFADVSCGGADTTHMTGWQRTLLGVFPPQLRALTPDTDLVTLGIGGNDYGVFGRIIDTCPGLRASDPGGEPCRRHFTVGGVDTLRADIDNTRARIAEVVRGIKARSPRATVLLVGYPRIAPAAGTCPSILPFADGDYAYLNSIEEYLNAAVQQAAQAGGATYVDTFGPSAGHDACAPDGQAWIQGKDIDLFRALNYHPRYEGQAGVADLTFETLSGVRPVITRAEQAAFAAEGRRLRAAAAADPSLKPMLTRLAAGR